MDSYCASITDLVKNKFSDLFILIQNLRTKIFPQNINIPSTTEPLLSPTNQTHSVDIQHVQSVEKKLFNDSQNDLTNNPPHINVLNVSTNEQSLDKNLNINFPNFTTNHLNLDLYNLSSLQNNQTSFQNNQTNSNYTLLS